MIKSIDIKGFRGIESGAINKFRQFNIFVGANNSGKSAVMEAIYLASTVNQEVGLVRQVDEVTLSNTVLLAEQDLLNNNPLNLIVSKHSDSTGLLNFSREKDAIVSINVKDSKAVLQKFDLDWSEKKLPSEKLPNDRLFLFGFDIKKNQNNLTDEHLDEDFFKLFWQHTKKLANKTRTVFWWYPDLTYYYKGSAVWSIEGQPPAAKHTLFCDTSMVQSYIPIDFYRQVLNEVPGWTQRIAKHFGTIFEITDPFTVQFVPITGYPDRLQGWIAREDKPALSIDAFGDGARAAFKLLVPLVVMAEMATEEEPGLLLWEEPEAFQNPQTLGNLLREVVKMIQDKPIQVFISTHNLEFLAYITQMMENKHLNSEKTMAFHLSLSDGQLRSSWFDQDTLLTWLDSGIDPRAWKDFIPPFQFQLQEK
ncbi:AAA family ATPase [Spirulina subsalsa]|uniref:AAA family ATPase n=1 Tax=Spirulina subsalsa TaxID=54311 RepID=UPI0002DF0BE3|nr:ATP-binding protein [Spirulina subsalsa]